jgi:hypothetical protein
MADQWFYAQGGQHIGPVTFEQLTQLARSGGLTANDLVWQEGMPDWQPAGQVAGLFAAAASNYAPTAAPYPAQPQSPVPAQPINYSGPYQPPQHGYPAGSVPNYLVQSILVTVLCCWPFGIPAIVYAAQVNSKLAQGDYQGAVAASKNAKMWSWISFGLGASVVVFYLLIMVVAGVAGR